MEIVIKEIRRQVFGKRPAIITVSIFNDDGTERMSINLPAKFFVDFENVKEEQAVRFITKNRLESSETKPDILGDIG